MPLFCRVDDCRWFVYAVIVFYFLSKLQKHLGFPFGASNGDTSCILIFIILLSRIGPSLEASIIIPISFGNIFLIQFSINDVVNEKTNQIQFSMLSHFNLWFIDEIFIPLCQTNRSFINMAFIGYVLAVGSVELLRGMPSPWQIRALPWVYGDDGELQYLCVFCNYSM